MTLSPLYIPTIVSEVFSYLDVPDVKSCRLMCELWCEEGTKTLMTTSKYHFKKEEDVKGFLARFRDNSSSSKLSSIKFFNIKLAYGSYLLNEHDYDFEDTLSKVSSCFDLMDTLGWKIKYLELGYNTWKLGSLWNVLVNYTLNLEHLCFHCRGKNEFGFRIKNQSSESIPILPSLKHIALKYIGNGRPEEYGHFILPSGLHDVVPDASCVISRLFRGMPNLEKFSCDNSKIGEEIFQNLLSNLPQSSDTAPTNPKFSEFGFELNLNEDEVRHLHQLNFPLKSLDLSLRPGFRFPGLYSFLSSLGQTLHTLSLNFIFIPQNTEKFPCGSDLINLKYLRLQKFNGSLDFIHHMGKLKTLVLVDVNLSVAFRDDGNFDFETPHGLKSFEMFNGHSNAGRFSFPHIFKKMVKLFPKIEKYRMDYVSDVSFKIISDGFTQLRELILDNCICTDKSILGERTDQAHASTESVEIVWWERGSGALASEVDGYSQISNASISNLKQLRILHLKSRLITDASLVHGLSKCKELQVLHLCSALITPGGVQVVAKNLSLKSLLLEECYRISSADIDELRKVIPDVIVK